MTIDLNNPSQFTIENFRELISLGDDSHNNQIQVTKTGILSLSQNISPQNGNLCFRLESFAAGGDYVGKGASENDQWINKLFEVIKKNWPNPYTPYIDSF